MIDINPHIEKLELLKEYMNEVIDYGYHPIQRIQVIASNCSIIYSGRMTLEEWIKYGKPSTRDLMCNKESFKNKSYAKTIH